VVIALNRLKKKAALEPADVNRCLRLFKEKPSVAVAELVIERLKPKQTNTGSRKLLEMLA